MKVTFETNVADRVNRGNGMRQGNRTWILLDV